MFQLKARSAITFIMLATVLIVSSIQNVSAAPKANFFNALAWDQNPIPVCWESSGMARGFREEREWVKDIINRTWVQNSRVRFTGWGACTTGSSGIRIRVADENPRVAEFGSDLDGVVNGVTLNFTYQIYNTNPCSLDGYRELCTKANAVHEFGHALGFAHEQDRSDTPTWCNDQPLEYGAERFGVWDANSIMNYCNPIYDFISQWNQSISAGDIAAVQHFYGDLNFMDSSNHYVNSNWGGRRWVKSGDFNGDGIDDIASPYYNYIFVKQGKPDGFDAYTRWASGGWGHYNTTYAGDFNGDGIDDIASFYTDRIQNGAPGTTMHMKFGQPYGFKNHNVYASYQWGSTSYIRIGDFNGDGIDDIASPKGGKVYMKFGNTDMGAVDLNGTIYNFTNASWSVANAWGSSSHTFVGDFNGDGFDDLASHSGAYIYMKYGSANGFTSQTVKGKGSWGNSSYIRIGDFNGDGYDDIASPSGGVVYMRFGSSNGLVYRRVLSRNSWGGAAYTWVGDFDGDGQDDIVSASGGNLHVKLFWEGRFIGQTWPVTNDWGGSAYTKVGDFNGDGKLDIASGKGGYIKLKAGNHGE